MVIRPAVNHEHSSGVRSALPGAAEPQGDLFIYFGGPIHSGLWPGGAAEAGDAGVPLGRPRAGLRRLPFPGGPAPRGSSASGEGSLPRSVSQAGPPPTGVWLQSAHRPHF